MNANEVIANRALELMGRRKGEYQYCDPHDHINGSQSTNDAYPSALHIGMAFGNIELVAAVNELIAAFRDKGREFGGVLKMGRTQLQDAVPMTLGQEFEAFAATLAGEVQALFGALPPLLPHVNAKRIQALAISSGKRSVSVPHVPTVAESGYPGFNMALWLGFFAPRGTPPAVMKRLETELVAIANAPETKDQMLKQGLEAASLGSAELGKLLKVEIENYKSVFKSAGIKIE